MSRQPNASFLVATSAAALVATTCWLLTVRQNALLKRQLSKLAKGNDALEHAPSNVKHQDNKNSKNQNDTNNKIKSSTTESSSTTITAIGTICSPFPQRAGCPRQGTLAPHVVSYLVFNKELTREALDGMEEYSHVWILFGFHLNPQSKAKSSSTRKSSKFPCKVRPPRAPHKVGTLATRSPHRPNAIGLSCALLEKVRHGKSLELVLKGLDLVDGTPVYDVKPYVPWDTIPNIVSSQEYKHKDVSWRMQHLRVPPWVSSDKDVLTSVRWSTQANDKLRVALQQGHLSPFYVSNGDSDIVTNKEVSCAIEEIVRQDPRAIRDGRGNANSEDSFEFTFGNLRVEFRIVNNNEGTKQATVTNVLVDQGDVTASVGSYPHSLALRRKAEAGFKLDWAFPVREGNTHGLFELANGTTWEPSERA